MARPKSRLPKSKRPPGAQALYDWRKANDLTQVDVCQRLDLDGGRYSAYETGRLTPGLEIAAKIQVVTGGKVPAVLWVRNPETARALAS